MLRIQVLLSMLCAVCAVAVALVKPLAVERAYKSNTWTPLDAERFSGLSRSVDYLIVGVGA